MKTALKSTWIWVAIVGLSAIALGFIALPDFRKAKAKTVVPGGIEAPRNVEYQWKDESGWSYSYNANTGATGGAVVAGGEGTHTLALQRAHEGESAKNLYRVYAYGSFNGRRWPNMDKPGILMLTPVGTANYSSPSDATRAAVQWVSDYAAQEATPSTPSGAETQQQTGPDEATVNEAAFKIQGVDAYDVSSVGDTVVYTDPFAQI